MPKILDNMVGKMTKKGLPKPIATAIATKSLQRQGVLKKGSTELTTKGERVNSLLTPNAVAGMSTGKKKKKGTGAKKKAKMPMRKSTPSKATKGRKPMKKMTTKKKKP